MLSICCNCHTWNHKEIGKHSQKVRKIKPVRNK